MKIAVLGGGNVAQTMAADLAHRGFKVALCEHPNFKKNIEKLLETHEIELSGALEFTQKIDTVTTDFRDAVEGADFIMLPIPAFAQKPMFEQILPHLEDGQIVVFSPGNFGSLEAAQILKQKQIKKKIILGETSSGLYFTRIIEPCKIHVIGGYFKDNFAAFPAKYNEEAFDVYEEVFPGSTLGETVISVCMMNINYPFHSAGSILNAGAIEFASMGLPPWPKKRYYVLHIHGMSPRVARVVTQVYEEILSVRSALGYSRPSEYDREKFYEEMANMYKNENLRWGYGPDSLDHRYITEDIPYGLVPISGLADMTGTPVPTIKALIHLACILNDTDYWKIRPIEELGIAGMNVERLRKYLVEGE